MPAMSDCLACGAASVQMILDLGPQPPSNRFESPDNPSGDRHALIVGQCRACSLVQLLNPMPAAMAKSRYEWLTYNEPERHLDDLVARLCRLPGIASQSRVVGLTYKDDSTLARFTRLAFANTYRYEMAADLGLHDRCAGLESIQAAVAPLAGRLAERHGQADILLARHILEHAHDPMAFIEALKRLVRSGGYLVFEMPDATKFVRALDYSFLWEEHITYFSRTSLHALLGRAQLATYDTVVYDYPFEDSLIAIARNTRPASRASLETTALSAMLQDGERFGRDFSKVKNRLQALLADWQRSGKRIAIFGAGHLAAKFVNLFSLSKYVECVIDDSSSKQELLMPGSRLAIRGSAALDGIDLCMLSLSPESEAKVRAKNQAYLDRGGRFLSIFALSPQSIHAEAAT